MVDRTEQIRGEFYLHRVLWIDALNLCDLYAELDRGGAYSCAIGGLILLASVLEGFANFLGAKLRPEVWAQEREHFSSGEFRGTLGKLTYLAQELEFKIDKGARPYQTLQDLLSRRNYLVHNSIEVFGDERAFDPAQAFKYVPKYRNAAEDTFLARARGDIELFCDQLQAHAYARNRIQELSGPALRNVSGFTHGMIS